jgi:hypothetical protein
MVEVAFGGVGVRVGVDEGLGVGVLVGAEVLVGVTVGVGDSSALGVEVGLGDGVWVGVGAVVEFGVGVIVELGVGVVVKVGVGVGDEISPVIRPLPASNPMITSNAATDANNTGFLSIQRSRMDAATPANGPTSLKLRVPSTPSRKS